MGPFFPILVQACCQARVSLAGALGCPRGSAPNRSQKPGRPPPSRAPWGARVALRSLPARAVAYRSCAARGAVPEELRNEERTRHCWKLPRLVRDTLLKRAPVCDAVCAVAFGHSGPSTLQTKYWETQPCLWRTEESNSHLAPAEMALYT